jgi:enoyl-CoA hydratase
VSAPNIQQPASVFVDGSIGGVQIVRLSNPPHNFMTKAMVEELAHVVNAVERNDEIRAVIITSETPHTFITHFEVAEVRAEATKVAPTLSRRTARAALAIVRAASRLRPLRRLLSRTPVGALISVLDVASLYAMIASSEKVFIAAINGFAVGAGCELALACDVRLMADGDYRIGLPELRLNQTPLLGIPLLARAVGPSRARLMLFDARLMSPVEAEAANLVNEVVAPPALMDRAVALATRVAMHPSTVIADFKRALNAGDGLTSSATREAIACFVASASTAQSRESVRGYCDAFESRDPQTPSAVCGLLNGWGDDQSR